ncbi:MAG: T9SS type A sorting domain-containing protein, partial [Saprospiraceae bacterium]|nr:T9SS type A sorting domain-containing protein [Saprospiraceae bacterium]
VAFTASENFDYNASIFLSGIQGTPRFTGMLAIEGDLASASFSSLGFGRDIAPVERMTVGPEEVTSTKEPKIDLNNQFALYPNPTKGPTQLQFNLADIAPEVQIEMFDISGRLKWFTQLDNVRRDIVRIPTEDLVQGSYTIRITTDKGVGTKKLLFLEP